VGSDDEQIDVLVANKGTGNFGDFPLLHPAPIVDSVETMVTVKPGDEVIAVAAHDVGKRGHHFRNEGEFRRPEQMKEMQSCAEMPSNREAVFDSMFRARRKVGGHSDVPDGHGRIAIESHTKPPRKSVSGSRADRILLRIAFPSNRAMRRAPLLLGRRLQSFCRDSLALRGVLAVMPGHCLGDVLGRQPAVMIRLQNVYADGSRRGGRWDYGIGHSSSVDRSGSPRRRWSIE
jgi:hypothetical protein